MSQTINATVQIHRSESMQRLANLLMDEPSGVYMVTVHNRQVVKVARVEREIVLQPKTAADGPKPT